MNVFDLFARISLDTSEYDKGLDEASSKSSSFASKIGSGLATAAKAGAVAIGAAATAVGGLAKQSIDAYADFEQLAGGIETLFGDSAQKVMADANEAFKTAGMSANEYMETSIQSAAALINSLGGDQAAAADLMNMSITDMADNVNKMGTTMEAVQNAYRGFSRGNFTLLDNLALGFAGTKEGMEELLAKAQEFSGVEYDISSYADIVEAIHVVQTEMGITGTTAREASETISGSFAALKSAWTNLVAGLANDEADIDGLINNVVDGAETVFNNVLPVAEKALAGVGSLVEKIAPIIADKLPAIIDQLLPILINVSMALLNGLVSAAPTILQTLVSQLPTIFRFLVDSILNLTPMLLSVGLDIILTLADSLTQNLPTLIPAIVDVILQIVETLTDPDTLVQLVEAGLQLIIALGQGILAAVPELVARIPEIVINLATALIQAAPILLSAVLELLSMIWSELKTYGEKLIGWIGDVGSDFLSRVKENGKNTLESIVDWLSQLPEKFAYWAGYAIGEFIIFVAELPGKVQEFLHEVLVKVGEFGFNFVTQAPKIASNFKDKLINTIKDLPEKFMKIGGDIVSGLWNGLKNGWNWLTDKVKDLASSLLQGAKDALGIASPSKEFAWVGKMVDEGFALGIEQNEHLPVEQAKKSFSFADDLVTDVKNDAVQTRSSTSNASDIESIVRGVLSEMSFVVPVYIGGDKVDEKIINVINTDNFRSGGR